MDDGFSGLNFNRPGFQRLLSDIDRGCICTVITKDLSRLGRDYIQTGYYIDMYFKERNVRYIAVNDNVDTDQGENDITPFKNILNEMLPLRRVTVQQHQQIALGMNSMIGQLQMKHLSSSFFEM